MSRSECGKTHSEGGPILSISKKLIGAIFISLGAVAVACAHGDSMPIGDPLRSGQVSAEAVTEIAIERRCFGCDRELKLILKRDRTAVKTMFGNARRGTPDRQFVAIVPLLEFDRLARIVVSAEFFQFLEEYRDPSVADGEWVMTTVTAGGRRKSVIDRDAMAPVALRGVQARIEELANTLSWKEIQ